ncbi:F-box domain-containing protein [Mycena kentingensis (nom. inval.)]|nr:F-box domain-containing protein [Mycena kentingensis (nom. inval.)]
MNATEDLFVPSKFLERTVLDHALRTLRENCEIPLGIDASLAEIRRDVARYDAEILRLKTQLDRRQAQRSSLELLETRMGGLLARARPLPAELLVEIFLHHRDNSLLRTAGQRLCLTQLKTLAMVCYHWRQVVLNTPALWTDVNIDGRIWRDPARLVDATRALEDVLQRSANTSISIRVNYPNRDLFVRAWRLIVATAHRWRSAKFVHCGECTAPLDLFSDISRMETLEIVLNSHGPSADSWLEAVRRISCAPRLCDLALTGHFDVAHLPLEQLRRVSLGDLSTTSLPIIFAILPRLVAPLKLTLVPSWGPPPLPLSSIASRLPSLTLGLDSQSGDASYTVFQAFLAGATFSCLHTLAFVCGKYGDPPLLPWPHDAFLRFSERSGFATTLLALNLGQVFLPDATFGEILAALPALQTLEVSDSRTANAPTLFGDALLQRLRDQPDTLVPRLATLKYTTQLRFSEGLFFTFVSWRVHSQKLRALHLEWFRVHNTYLPETPMEALLGLRFPAPSFKFALEMLKREAAPGFELKIWRRMGRRSHWVAYNED